MKINGIMEWWNGGGLRASSQHPNTPAPHLRNGFTLIELLAVVAIMSIILVAAIPVFQAMGKRDLGTASSQLRATLRLARQYAVTQRRYVYVVFPGQSITYSGALTNHLYKCLRAYSVMVQSSDALPASYEYITDWKYLPQGVYFDDGPTVQPNTRIGTVFAGVTQLPFPDSSSGNHLMSAIRFAPNGRSARYRGGWEDVDTTVYATTAHFYNRNAAGTGLQRGGDIAGVTNTVRVRRWTGQVDIRDGLSN